MVSNNNDNNIVPLRSSSTSEKIDKAKRDLWSDYLKTRQRSSVLHSAIDEILPKVLAAIDRDIEAGKITAITASKILANLNNVVHKQDSLSFLKNKMIVGGGPVVEDSAIDKHAPKSTLSDKDKKALQKAAESTLVELIKLKQAKQSTEA